MQMYHHLVRRYSTSTLLLGASGMAGAGLAGYYYWHRPMISSTTKTKMMSNPMSSSSSSSSSSSMSMSGTNNNNNQRWLDGWDEYGGGKLMWDSGKPTRTARLFLNELLPDVPAIKDWGQAKSIRVLVPLCGATYDMRAISTHVEQKIEERAKDFIRNSTTASVSPSPANTSASSASAVPLAVMTNTAGVEHHRLVTDALKNYKYKIIGVEENERALQVFMNRECPNNYKIESDESGKARIYRGDNFQLICSDIFAGQIPRMVSEVDAVYDRLALVTLNPEQRKDYIQLLRSILSKDGKILLTVFRYNPEERSKSLAKQVKLWEEELRQAKDSSTQEKLKTQIKDYTRNKKILRPPYSLTQQEVTQLFEPITNGDRSKVKLLSSIKCVDSDDEWEKARPQGLRTNPNETFVDVYLIQNGTKSSAKR